MGKKNLLRKVMDTAHMLYQNREQEGVKAVTELLSEFQILIQNMPEEQKKDCEKFSLIMFRELIAYYKQQDMIGMADCLIEKATLFVQYMPYDYQIEDGI